MRRTLVNIFIIGILSTMFLVFAYANGDGLHFNSHSYTTAYRTTLQLDNGNEIDVDDGFNMSFNIDLRPGESLFGNIFCIKTNDGKHIDAILSMPAEGINKPVLVVDGKLYYINSDVKAGNNIKAEITIDKKNNRIVYSFRGHKTIVQTDLRKASSATILFGMHRNDGNYVDVAPMNVRNIKISYNGEVKYFWDLRQHTENVCYDKISHTPATAINGHWILDDHVKWENLFTYRSKDKVQVTYNPLESVFYIVDSKAVRCYNPKTGTMKVINVKGGYRAMMYSNYIGYSQNGIGLYTYNVKDDIISRFDFTTGEWSNKKYITDEPSGFNHSWAMANDSIAYIFGGYGFYKYNNSLWRINTKSGEIRKLDYSPKINPRTGAATAIVGNKLYIFGGYGNEAGEQELPCSYYYDLSCIDLNTLKSETLWTTEGEQQNTSFMLASEMLYNSKDSTFYAATTYKNGRMIKISIKEPGWKIVTDGIGGDFVYKDMTFDMYKSDKDGKVYVVIDRRMNNLEHNIRICSIDLPLQDDYMIEDEENKAESSSWWWMLLTVIPIAGALIYYIRRRRSGKAMTTDNRATEVSKETTVAETLEGKAPENANVLSSSADDVSGEENKEKSETHRKYYNPKGGYISLLGKFVVHDRNGEDITSLFTRRTRNLLLILLLHSEGNSKGIEMHMLDEALWQEMNEESARNNRNVYMRKLRVLLEKVGNVEVVNDKIHYRIEIGDDVFFDYREVLAMMKRMEEDDSEETTARTIELLFEGPLLPNYSFEWLDKFKADYSNAVISLLTRLLRNEQQNRNDKLALKIAETILMHDPFSDDALAAQCHILCRRHKKGIAKQAYDSFCKNYEACMGEKYQISFAELCK